MDSLDIEEQEILESSLRDMFDVSGMETCYDIIQISIKLRLRSSFTQELW